MLAWIPLLVPPVLVLALQSLNYALEPWVCAKQIIYPLHVTAAVVLVAVLAAAGLAWREWQTAGGKAPDDRAVAESRRTFLAVVGLLVSTLSAIGTIALWLTQFIVLPCMR